MSEEKTRSGATHVSRRRKPEGGTVNGGGVEGGEPGAALGTRKYSVLSSRRAAETFIAASSPSIILLPSRLWTQDMLVGDGTLGVALGTRKYLVH